MKAIAIIKQDSVGIPEVNLQLNFVHLGGISLTGNYKAYNIAGTEATLDELELLPECVVLIRLVNKTEEGELTYSELNEELPELLDTFNYFMSENELTTFPSGTTAKEIFEYFQINPKDYFISDIE